ncbi:MAG TPA: hypothetical protein GX731_02600 [Clostridiales bacterium]|nr:hypothetical protein [Clostridiales bacterium]
MNKKEIEELQKLMTYNENGEGVINGKTILELEAESMTKLVENQKSKQFNRIYKNMQKKKPHNNNHKYREKKIIRLLKNNTYIIIGIGISLLFIIVYQTFKTKDENINVSLLSGLIGGLGAIIAIILSISFSKRSNEQSLDSSVMPYIIVKRTKELPSTYVAFKYFSDEEKLFDGWRQFDFNTIKDNKRLLVRNGVAYLRLENIGLGPAKRMNIKIGNFGVLFLDKDYLQPSEVMNIIFDFNKPGKDEKADLTIEYETIRNIHHAQKIGANVTWHLDRTNFSLFS